MESVGLDVFGVDLPRLAALVIAMSGAAMTLYHLFALWVMRRDKRRLVEAVGPIAFVNGGLFAERGVHHRLRALLFAVIAAAALALV